MPALIDWGPPLRGLRMASVFPRPYHRTHQRITATILVRNVGRRTVSLVSTQPVADYTASVLGPDGRPAATTVAYANAVAFAATGQITRTFKTTLAPGDVFEDLYEVSHWFDLPKTGEYRFSIRLAQWAAGRRLLAARTVPFAVMRALRP